VEGVAGGVDGWGEEDSAGSFQHGSNAGKSGRR
jgi:hypothetical protein